MMTLEERCETYLDELCDRTAITDDDTITRSVAAAMMTAAESLERLNRSKSGHDGPFTVEVPETALMWLTVAAMAATGYRTDD